MARTQSNYDYGWEKLYYAVRALSGRAPEQRDRLKSALIGSLIHIQPEVDLPKKIRSDFIEFMRGMTSVKATGNEGNINATVDSLDDPAISDAVEKIIGFYDTTCHVRRRED